MSQARAEAGDIVFARAEDADSLDNARVSSTISLQVMTQIYEPLLTLDADGKIHGGLAQSWTPLLAGDGDDDLIEVPFGTLAEGSPASVASSTVSAMAAPIPTLRTRFAPVRRSRL
jgi:hypothetical protein